jgi:RNA polymerase primary sigma factor
MNIIQMYLKEITKFPLLSHEEVVVLSNQMETAKQAKQLLDDKTISEELRLKHMNEIKDGRLAREKLIQSNYRLVISIAKRFSDFGLTLMDLVQEGNLGLMHAVDLFDIKRNVKFSTYATPWILQSITRALNNQSRLIRIPEYMIDKIRKMKKEESKLNSLLGREANDEELAKVMECPIENIIEMRMLSFKSLSLDAINNDEKNQSYKDSIESDELDPHHVYMGKIYKDIIERKWNQLSDIEQKVLGLRWGLEDGQKKTYQEICDKMSLNMNKIKKIEKSGIYKIYNHPN